MRLLLPTFLLLLFGCAAHNSFTEEPDVWSPTLTVANHSTAQVTVRHTTTSKLLGRCGSQATCQMDMERVHAQMAQSGRIAVKYRELGWGKQEFRYLQLPWAETDWTLDISTFRHLSWLAPTRAAEDK